jgi:hypothetical protein
MLRDSGLNPQDTAIVDEMKKRLPLIQELLDKSPAAMCPFMWNTYGPDGRTHPRLLVRR